MLKMQAEKTLAQILGIGALSTSVFILWDVVTDPVNVTKHFLLGAVALAAFVISAVFGIRLMWRETKTPILLAFLFFLFSINAVVNSASPLAQNIYGSYGRNTGFMAYLFLNLIFLASLTLRARTSFEWIIKSLLATGLINVVYALWAWQIGDFVGWSNPYNTILGTFGNPNFIGAFLGIFVSVLVAYLVSSRLNIGMKITGWVIVVVTFLEIEHSNAIQGIVVAAGGISIVIFFLIRAKFESLVPTLIYSLFVAISGVVAVLGALQKGPLTDLIYKTSVSLRGEYWNAGINMGREFPLTGVGMDSYGDWYRLLRRDSALILPGPSTITNAAHNVNLDLLAYGGWPLFASYVALVVFALVSVIKIALRKKSYDWVSVSLIVGWTCYQVQALISINQIGLAIWGWLLSGAVVAYEISTRENREVKTENSTSKRKLASGYIGNNFSPQLVSSVGLVIGGLLAVPPLSADMKWLSAQRSGSVEVVEAALVPSYLNPPNVNKYLQAVQLFETNQLPDLAYKYAKEAVQFNSNDFNSWKLLYAISKSTESDKAQALENMKRIDPKNPEIFSGITP
jgi:hypothetical protein